MAKEVVLTSIAEEDFYKVLDYLTLKWDEATVHDFLERFEKVLSQFEINASIYPYYDLTRNLQRCVLTKHNILYFEETEQTILIFTVFDTRQNPEKLNSII